MRAAQTVSPPTALFFSTTVEGLKLQPLLSQHTFFNQCEFIHCLIHNQPFRTLYEQQKGQFKKANNLLETFLKAHGFHDQLIQWVLKQTISMQAIIWQLATARPHLIEQFYHHQILPDQSLNVFDKISLDETEQVLQHREQINPELYVKAAAMIQLSHEEKNGLFDGEKYAVEKSDRGKSALFKRSQSLSKLGCRCFAALGPVPATGGRYF